MKFRNKLNSTGQLNQAVRNALAMSVAGTGFFSAGAIAQEAQPGSTELDTIEVTGSLLKQADIETASPVTVIDRAAIETSGVVTLGQLLQEMPNIAGAATNPQVNNGGGDGSATVSLRGLGSARTLLLLNGRRLVSVDVNAIPINMIERVEVLKDGASSTYGSDAIGGVVNFITRKTFQGSEYAATYGISARDDAALTGIYTTFGTGGANSNTVLGLNFDRRNAVSAAEREFSKAPFALYYGQQIVSGSSRNPNGVYGVPRTVAAAAGINCAGTGTNVTLTRRAGTAGTSMADFRCFDGAGAQNDTYNFQTVNVDLTPQERYGGFLSHNSKLTDTVDAFAEAFYHNTVSHFQIAPEPLDAATRGLVASSESIYNPFGVNVTDLRLRLVAVGNREEEYTTDRFQTTVGLTGDLFERFNWESRATYGKELINTDAFGELYAPGVQNAIGPSFYDAANGNAPTCGTAAAPIANCVPVNFFGIPDPAALGTLTPHVHDHYDTQLMLYHAKVRGDLFPLPAGALAGALGVERREEFAEYQPDYLREQSLISGNASSPVSGSFDVNELFAEFAVPLVADMPGVESLSASLGWRYSDYSTFGDTDNFKIGLEYRPVREALLRATYAEVFRSPTISNLYGGQNDSADSYTDPCNGYTGALNANPACINVPNDGSFQQQDSQLNARVGGNPLVQPESGDSYTFGLVWEPNFYDPLTIVVDFWHFSLEDTVGTVGTQNRLTQCFTRGLFCDSITRDANGNITQLIDVVDNVGSLETEGVDFGAQFRFGETPVGRLAFQLDATYLNFYDNEQLAGVPETLVHNAGDFNESSAGGDGNFPRLRANTHLSWGMGPWGAHWSTRYLSSVTEHPTDFGGLTFLIDREVPSVWYNDLVGTYNLARWKTEIALGIDNVTDEVAPLIYSGFNGTTDVRTYDVIGTFYYSRIKFSF